MTDNAFVHQEAWLHAVAARLGQLFASHGATIPDNILLASQALVPSASSRALSHATTYGWWRRGRCAVRKDKAVRRD
jgi:hypothetical protein